MTKWNDAPNVCRD